MEEDTNHMKLTIASKDWLGKLKKIENSNFDKMAQFIHFGKELNIINVVDVVKDIHIYEYAPIITFLELQDLCKNIEIKVDQFKDDISCIHYHLYKILLSVEDNVLKDTLILILKRPYALILKFGESKNINYVIQLENKTSMHLTDSRTCMFKENYYDPMLKNHKEIVKEMQNLSVMALVSESIDVKKTLAKQKQEIEHKMNSDVKEILKVEDDSSKIQEELIDNMKKLKELEKTRVTNDKNLSDLILQGYEFKEEEDDKKKKEKRKWF